MYPRQQVPDCLGLLASLQADVVTREQALGNGLTESAIKRLVGAGAWQRLARGVYRTAPAPSTPANGPGGLPWESWAWATVLVGGDRTRLGGLAAAHLHGLLDEPPAEILGLIPATVAIPSRPGPWTFRRERPGARLGRTVGSPPRIGIEDTVLDLCSETDEAGVVHWVTAAVQERRTTAKALAKAMRARYFVTHRRILEELLVDVGAGVRSPLELRYLRDVERAHGLPIGQRQYKRRRTEVDVSYEGYGLVVELDGRLGHQQGGVFRDMWRDNASTVDGLATLRFGHRDIVGCPCEAAQQVGTVLRARGWDGIVTRCDRCRRVR